VRGFVSRDEMLDAVLVVSATALRLLDCFNKLTCEMWCRGKPVVLWKGLGLEGMYSEFEN